MRLSRSLTRSAAAVTGAVVLSLACIGMPSGASAAGRPTPVDPATITPELNPTFTWSCVRLDDKTLCEGERHDSWEALNTGIPCGDGWLWSTGTDDRTLRRWGDAEGRALRTQGHATIRETLSLTADMTGPTAEATGQFNERFRYTTPGDLSSRVQIKSGIDLSVTVRGEGLVIHDVGVKSYDIEDNLLFAHGPKDLDDLEAAAAQMCAALLAA